MFRYIVQLNRSVEYADQLILEPDFGAIDAASVIFDLACGELFPGSFVVLYKRLEWIDEVCYEYTN